MEHYLKMNYEKPFNLFTIKPITILWLFMYIVLFTSPLFPGPGTSGFHTVEYSFFTFGFLLMWLTAIAIMQKGIIKFKWDPVLYLCIVFVTLLSASIIDAPNKLKGVLFTGQYIPYFFIMYLVITLVDNEKKYKTVLDFLNILAFLFSLLIISMALKFNDRSTLDDFLVNNFLLETTKILTYLELTFAILVYQIFNARVRIFHYFVIISIFLAIMLSGSRGNMVILALTFLISFIKGTFSIKKILLIMGALFCMVFMMFTIDYVKERTVLLTGLVSQKSFEEKITAYSRLYTAMVALELMKSHPINGVGTGNLSYFTENILRETKGIPEQIIIYWNKHGQVFQTNTTPLKLGAELGIGGFLFFFIFYYYLWKRVNRSLPPASDYMRTILNGVKVFVIVGFIHNFTEPAFTNYYSWFFYGMVIAACRIAVNKDVKIS
jgi:hypothetical protein